jgi:plastocyanin
MALHQNATKLLLALSLCAGLAGLAACGGGQPAAAGKPAASSMPNMSSMESSAASAPAAPVATNAVVISNFAFGPQTITVKVGTTVTWTNKDTDEHTVTAQNGSFNSAPLATNATYQHTFTKAGTYDYLCTIHPFMTATVVVTP